MAEVRIICINKDGGNHNNPHEGITHYGWHSYITGNSDKLERADMVTWIEKGNKAYVQDNLGNKAYCTVRESPAGNKFLQTVSDSKYTDNLLSLPECK
jgi:hypothetical protein